MRQRDCFPFLASQVLSPLSDGVNPEAKGEFAHLVLATEIPEW